MVLFQSLERKAERKRLVSFLTCSSMMLLSGKITNPPDKTLDKFISFQNMLLQSQADHSLLDVLPMLQFQKDRETLLQVVITPFPPRDFEGQFFFSQFSFHSGTTQRYTCRLLFIRIVLLIQAEYSYFSLILG